MDYQQLRDSHRAFQRQPGQIRGTWLNHEYRAMIAGGLTDDQWYTMPRDQRALRVAHLLANETIKAAAEFDAVEQVKHDSPQNRR